LPQYLNIYLYLLKAWHHKLSPRLHILNI